MQVSTSYIAAMYYDAYSMQGLCAGSTDREKNAHFALENQKNYVSSKASQSHMYVDETKEEQSLISSQALKAPAGVREADMAFSYLTSSTTLNISETAKFLFET